MGVQPRCLDRASWEARALFDRYPPKLSHGSKAAAFRHLMDAGAAPAGTVGMSRWDAGDLPRRRNPPAALRLVPGFFTYDDPPGAAAWHVNFAASDLFYACGSALLAQDELQVLEHPVLAALRTALLAEGRSTLTVERGRPTPILVTGAERRGRLDTGPTRSRPYGLYGNEFAASPVSAMLEALAPIVPPTISNIVAMEAPAYGSGRYTAAELRYVLRTATTGFRSAVLEGERVQPGGRTIVHTGWWGCGAYGGNKELMGLLQLEAAALAGVDELVFHTGEHDGHAHMERVLRAAESLADAESVGDFLDAVLRRNYAWGVGNGT